jgi:hypothetical protein
MNLISWLIQYVFGFIFLCHGILLMGFTAHVSHPAIPEINELTNTIVKTLGMTEIILGLLQIWGSHLEGFGGLSHQV